MSANEINTTTANGMSRKMTYFSETKAKHTHTECVSLFIIVITSIVVMVVAFHSLLFAHGVFGSILRICCLLAGAVTAALAVHQLPLCVCVCVNINFCAPGQYST